MAIVREHTAEKLAARALLEASRHKDEFIATLAHELRNPLAPIRTGLQILDRAPPDSPHARNARQMMKRQMRHIVRMVDDLLDISRISRGKLEIAREPVRLRAVIDDGLEASRAAVETSGHLLLVRHPPEPLWVDGDPTRLAQVVANLVNNAARYTPRGGRISVTLERQGDEGVLTVSDNGVGIAPEDRAHLFDMFVQGPGRETLGGLGVGLALVRRLVELHGGTVEAASAGLGLGATFSVRLPLAPPQPADDPVSAPIIGATTRRVLVVDDDLDTGTGLATILELAGHQTAIAATGEEALVLASAVEPDVVLCDIEMPGMSGHEVAARLRADPRHRGRLLVALSGRGGAEEQERSRAAGFDLHLTKPVDASAVEALLERWTPSPS
jgi:two-component system, sensor histidine kinase